MPVTIMLDRERTLRLTMRGLFAFKKATGKDLIKGIGKEEFTAEDSMALLWACLIHEDRELTLEQVENIVDLSNLSVVQNAITEYMTEIGKQAPLATAQT